MGSGQESALLPDPRQALKWMGKSISHSGDGGASGQETAVVLSR